MLNNANPLARTVLQMMARFGGDADLVVTGEPVYDPETSTATASETTYQVRVLVFDYIQKTNGLTTAAGGVIRTGDKQMFLKPDDCVPPPEAKSQAILFQGHKYNILVVKETNPSGTNPLLYELYVRE